AWAGSALAQLFREPEIRAILPAVRNAALLVQGLGPRGQLAGVLSLSLAPQMAQELESRACAGPKGERSGAGRHLRVCGPSIGFERRAWETSTDGRHLFTWASTEGSLAWWAALPLGTRQPRAETLAVARLHLGGLLASVRDLFDPSAQ